MLYYKFFIKYNFYKLLLYMKEQNHKIFVEMNTM